MKRLKKILLNIALILALVSTTNVFAAYTSVYQATKAAVQGNGGSALKNHATVGGSIPVAYSEYGFGTIKNNNKTFFGGKTGGKNPYKSYWYNSYDFMYDENDVISTAPSSSENLYKIKICIQTILYSKF